MARTHEFVLSTPLPLGDVVLVDDLVVAQAAPAQPRESLAEQANKVDRAEREALQRVLQQLGEVAEDLQAQQKLRLEEMQRVAVELAVAIASRLVHERLEKGEFAVEELVRQAVERLETHQPVTVYLNPQDLALLEARTAGSDVLTSSASLRILADNALGRGDCRAEVGDVNVLTRVQEQLADIRRHLLEILPDAALDRRRPGTAERGLRRYPDRRHTA